MKAQIPVDKARIADLCRRRSIRRLALFGSVLRNDFRPDSDVDVLVEFAPGATPGLMGFGQVERELSEILGGRKVDLVTERFLHERIRDRVLSTAEVQFGEK